MEKTRQKVLKALNKQINRILRYGADPKEKQNRRHFSIPYYVNEPFNEICDEYRLFYSQVVSKLMMLFVRFYEKAEEKEDMAEFEKFLDDLWDSA